MAFDPSAILPPDNSTIQENANGNLEAFLTVDILGDFETDLGDWSITDSGFGSGRSDTYSNRGTWAVNINEQSSDTGTIFVERTVDLSNYEELVFHFLWQGTYSGDSSVEVFVSVDGTDVYTETTDNLTAEEWVKVVDDEITPDSTATTATIQVGARDNSTDNGINLWIDDVRGITVFPAKEENVESGAGN